MANSKLATWKWSGKTDHYNTRNHKIDKITPHHWAGKGTLSGCCTSVQNRNGSVNYLIDNDGKIGVMVDEQYRAWTSSSSENDMRAVTIEVSNSCDAKDGDRLGWPVSDKALASLINLCVDICKRNNIKKLNYTGDKTGNLTMHKMFAATGCPGPYLSSKFPYIVSEVNKRLGSGSSDNKSSDKSETIYRVRKSKDDEKSQIGAFKNLNNAKKACKAGYKVFDAAGKVVYEPTSSFKSYKVKVTVSALNIRSGAGVSNKIVGCIRDKGTYTIVSEKTVGSQKWGKLKSNAGWICLTGYTKKV